MQELLITTNHFDPNAWERFEVEDCRAKLVEYFKGNWPPTARIYHECVDQKHDVTPKGASDHEKLAKLEGKILVVVYPASGLGDTLERIPDPLKVLFAPVYLANWAAAKVIGFAFKPDNVKAPREMQQGSPNTLLGKRENTARVNGRIPDIYGRVRAYPDLIQATIRTFENNVEIETLYACIGRGAFDFQDTSVIKDGDTPIESIIGAKCKIYGPNTSPNSGTPQIDIGGPISHPLMKILRCNEVDGQSMPMTHRMNIPTPKEINSSTPPPFLIFTEPENEVNLFLTGGEIMDLKDRLPIGQQVTIVGATFPPASSSSSNEPQNIGNVAGLDLSGTYTILDHIGENPTTGIVLDNPGAVNSDWNTSFDAAINRRFTNFPYLRNTGFSGIAMFVTNWIGPFVVNVADMEHVWFNFIAPNGLYLLDETNQWGLRVVIEIGLTPCDLTGTPTHSETFVEVSMDGSQYFISPIAKTFAFDLSVTTGVTGPHLVRARTKDLGRVFSDGTFQSNDFTNLTQGAVTTTGQVADDIQWLDLYGITVVPDEHFGDVTTAHVQIKKTPRALAIKDRKFNCVVTRLVKHWNGASFDVSPIVSRRTDDILATIITDNYIGRSFASPLLTSIADFDAIYASVAQVEEYFGNQLSVTFDWTFDRDELSYEDILGTVATASFLNVYRQGSVVTATPDIATTPPVLLCNHRNKIVGSESRQVQFSTFADNDSVEVDYVDFSTGVTRTYVFPEDEPRFSPKRVDVIGIGSLAQAFWHGQRAYAKLGQQNVVASFEATEDLAYVAVKDKIILADNTRVVSSTSPTDGEVLRVNNLIVTCSQPTNQMAVGEKVVAFQLPNGTTEQIGCVTGPGSFDITLDSAPSQPLITDDNTGRRTRYIIALETDRIPREFQIIDKQPADKLTYSIRAVNLTPVIYLADTMTTWLEPINTQFLSTAPFSVGAASGVFGAPSVTFNGSGLLPRNDNVYVGNSAGDYIGYLVPVATESYTFIAWIKINPAAGNIHSIIMSNEITRRIQFVVSPSSGGQLRAGHNNQVHVSAPYTSTEWQHVAVTYNNATGDMVLYLNGVQVDSEVSVPAPTTLAFNYAIAGTPAGASESLIGNLWWARTFLSPLPPDAIYEDYRVTRVRD